MAWPDLQRKHRRIVDAIIFLPIVGAVLVLLPLLWKNNNENGEGVSTSSAMIYLFTIWLLMIVGAACLSAFFRRISAKSDD